MFILELQVYRAEPIIPSFHATLITVGSFFFYLHFFLSPLLTILLFAVYLLLFSNIFHLSFFVPPIPLPVLLPSKYSLPNLFILPIFKNMFPTGCLCFKTHINRSVF